MSAEGTVSTPGGRQQWLNFTLLMKRREASLPKEEKTDEQGLRGDPGETRTGIPTAPDNQEGP